MGDAGDGRRRRSRGERPAAGGDPGAPHARGAGRKAFLLRLPPELHAELKRWAAADLRSLNGQIEFLLRDALRRRRGGTGEGGE